MKVYAKCYGPKVDWLTDGREYEALSATDGCFFIVSDDGVRHRTSWADGCFARWERIVRDDASILKQCTHLTEAVWEDPDTDECIKISVDDTGDVSVREPNGFHHISAHLLAAINEAVARHKAANAEQSTS